MTNDRARARKKKRFAKTCRRTLRKVLLIPGKFPPVGVQAVEIATKICEIVGVFFVGTLIAHLTTENSAVAATNLVAGIAFFGLLVFLKLADYQDRLIRENMSNYIYIR